jgi:hypothetical protein
MLTWHLFFPAWNTVSRELENFSQNGAETSRGKSILMLALDCWITNHSERGTLILFHLRCNGYKILRCYVCGRKCMFGDTAILHTQIVFYFLILTILCACMCSIRPTLLSGGQSSWLQIQRSGFDSRHYQTFWDVMRPEWGWLSLISTIEKLLERKSGGSGQGIK